MIYLHCVFEDDPSFMVMRKMLAAFEGQYSIKSAANCHGFGKIKKHINAYNKAAAYVPYFIITDLDRQPCAPSLIEKWFQESPHPNMLFRVAVHEIESWLIADRKNFAQFIGLSQELIPLNPDEAEDPKQTLLSLVRKSRNKQLKADMIPKNADTPIGPLYNARLGNFIVNHWDIQAAINHSPSLHKANLALQKFIARLNVE
ncbi:MAG: DUF4276 family protein [Spirochaetia bacterium]|jgi:hypothetical protein|nr:DUF4276 family protein [Spirochaetia bacterium]